MSFKVHKTNDPKQFTPSFHTESKEETNHESKHDSDSERDNKNTGKNSFTSTSTQHNNTSYIRNHINGVVHLTKKTENPDLF